VARGVVLGRARDRRVQGGVSSRGKGSGVREGMLGTGWARKHFGPP
jgi:hypothetical protein